MYFRTEITRKVKFANDRQRIDPGLTSCTEHFHNDRFAVVGMRRESDHLDDHLVAR
jgi:hypothetical protein